jgi:hypothetical protein
VEKVASALEFINGHLENINWEKVAEEPIVGAGKGDTTLPLNEDGTPGTQNYETGEAASGKPPMNPGTDTATKEDGQTNPGESTLETDMKAVPGGTGEQPQLVEKSSSVRKLKSVLRKFAQEKHDEDEPKHEEKETPEEERIEEKAVDKAREEGQLPKKEEKKEEEEKSTSIRLVRSLWKQAEDEHDGNANISAGHEPLANPNASASGENVPKLPATAESQRDMIDSLERAIGYTKDDAKAEAKRQMGQVIDEPAQKKSTDPVLQNNLDAAGQAGVKISSVKATAARAYLRKIAEAGERKDATPEEKEKAEKLKELLAKKDADKEKSSQFGGDAAPGMGQ